MPAGISYDERTKTKERNIEVMRKQKNRHSHAVLIFPHLRPYLIPVSKS